MAATCHFKNRCIDLSRNARLLSNEETKDVGSLAALIYQYLKTTESLKNALHYCQCFITNLTKNLFSPDFNTSFMTNAGENATKETSLIQVVNCTLYRTRVREAAGQAWESARHVYYELGPDPSLRRTKNICLYHPSDDTFYPPAIGY